MKRKNNWSIAVSGSCAEGLPAVYRRKAREIGQAIAEAGCILFTGATTGFSLEAVKGARSVGGVVIGVSPAESCKEQLEKYERIDSKLWTQVIYTGVGYNMRDVIMIRSVDAAIYVGGGVGTLCEMVTAVDYQKVMGILDGSGGATDLREKIAQISHRFAPKYVVNGDPQELVDQVIKYLRKGAINEKI